MPRIRLVLPLLTLALAALACATFAPAQEKKPAKSKAPNKREVLNPPPGKAVPLTATPVNHMRIRKDFKVELLYTIPPGQGSWVAITTDPKGRLITSDQYGSLYRVTPPTLDSQGVKVETIPADIGEAQGLLWAFDSLYVVVNRGQKYASGLYRVRSSKNDDTLDTVEKLREIKGGGEHGPHAVILGPDKKSLYIVAGNHTPLIETQSTKVPYLWGEDFILPRQWDASGHARGILAPGGWICRTDKDGKSWDLVSMGYRNQYDIAFNRDGELFTFDSDMEWDMNTPWYRPIRVCHAFDGSEFGWRSGTGVYPNHYPDNLPPVCNIGQGSPTGIAFGYGARFPAKYQDALFMCDWSYGKLYAAHLKPAGASYVGDFEEFITGTPLPLTDIVVNPADGAMYFTTGGRKVTSGLYRITYVGSESTAPSKKDGEGADARALRHKLESYYGKKSPEGVDTAWPHLGSKDRFVRWAARTVLEFNDPSIYRDRALQDDTPQSSLAALLALIRTGKKGDTQLQGKILERLHRFEPSSLDAAQTLERLRLYQLAFIRLGDPDDASRQKAIEKIDPYVPSVSTEVNSEAMKLLVYLQARSAATKGIDLMIKAPTQEEQMDYALSLRNLKAGWTRQQRETYFAWFLKAANYRGGNSFAGFVRNIKSEAIDNLPAEEKTALKPLLEASPKIENPFANAKPRPFVKKYTVEELLPTVEAGLKDRDFTHGRQVFGEAKCFNCHRFGNEGGAFGPDLTALAGRFNPKDLLESIILPNKVISDQYAAVNIITLDGKVVSGRIINLHGDNMAVNTDMLDPNKLVNVSRKNIESMELSKISMMPEGLLDTFTQDEVLDLAAYLLSRGNPADPMFRKGSR